MFDLLCQLNLYTSVFCIYLFSLIVSRDFKLIREVYKVLFGDKNLKSEDDLSQYVSNLTFLLLPHLIMIWIKTIVGFRAWVNNFSRKSIESYFMHTFIYHIFSLISNTLIYAVQPQVSPSQVIAIILLTAVIGVIVTYPLYQFLKFKDKDMRLHQELWCGNIMDSSDAEQA